MCVCVKRTGRCVCERERECVREKERGEWGGGVCVREK